MIPSSPLKTAADNTHPRGIVPSVPRPLALEARFMFDGAAAIEVVSAVREGSDPAEPAQAPTPAPELKFFVLPSATGTQSATAPEAVTSGLALAQQQVQDFLARTPAEALFAFFDGGQAQASAVWLEVAQALRAEVLDGTREFRVEMLDGASLQGALGAFAAQGPQGKPVIYLNADWVAGGARAADIALVITEEVGHALDAWLNPTADTAGDEGQLFAATALSTGPLSDSYRTQLQQQDDHAVLTVAGLEVQAEMAQYRVTQAYAVVTAPFGSGGSTYPAEKEANTLFFDPTQPLGLADISTPATVSNFSGNDQIIELRVNSDGIAGLDTQYGWVSRMIKDGGQIKGFYFWRDPAFDSFGTTGNDDSSVTNNTGFILVLDTAWFDALKSVAGTSCKSVKTSSDPVGNALGDLVQANKPPVARDDALSTQEDTELTPTSRDQGLLSNDTDPDSGDTALLTVTGFSVNGTLYSPGETATIAGEGLLTVNADGTSTFKPALNFKGTVSGIAYTVSDGKGGTSTATVTVTVNAVNDTPVAEDDTVSTNEDTPLLLTLNDFGTFADVDGDALAKIQITTLENNGSLEYLNGSTWGAVTQDQEITAADIAAGKLRFVPDLNESGTLYTAIGFKVSDGTAFSASAYTLTMNVTAVNDTPVAEDDTVSTNEDTALSFGVMGNDSDVDGDLMKVTSFTVAGDPTSYTSGETATIAGEGTLTLNADGTFTFKPALNFKGTVSGITQTVSDGQGGTSTASVTITVNAVNDAPIAANDSVSGDEDTVLVGNVLSNDTDPDNDALNVTGFSIGGVDYPAGSTATIPDVGTVTITPNGDYTFTPLANYNGTIPFITYTVADTGNLTASAILSLNLNFVNDAPFARDDSASGDEDTVLVGNVLSNDTDPDYDTLNVTGFSIGGVDYPEGSAATIPDVGTVTITPNGDYTFTPLANYNGPAPLITYTVVDAGNLTSSANLSLALNSVTDAPIAKDDSAWGNENTILSVNVLSNDNDPDGDALIVTGFSVGGVDYTEGSTATILNVGSVTIAPNGDCTFESVAKYSGPVPLITYTVVAADNLTASARLYLKLISVNDAPIARDDSVFGDEDTVLSGNVLSNDTDPDGDALTVTDFSINGAKYTAGSVATIQNVGTFTIAPNGDCTFESENNYNGKGPLITYTVADSRNLTASAILSLALNPVNDAPIARYDSPSGDEDTVLFVNVLSNDNDPDGDTLTVTGFSIEDADYTAGSQATIQDVGVVTIAPNGACTFESLANFSGQVPLIIYTVVDSGSLTASAILSLNLNPVNDAPTAANDRASGDEDTVLVGNVLSNDTDPDNDALNVTGFSLGGVDYPAGSTATIPDVGTVTITPNGDYTFTPLANYNGTIPFITYTVADTGNLTASATLSLTLNSVNDAPIARDNVVSGNEDTVLSVNVLSNDTDPDGDALIVTGFSVGSAGYAAGSTATIRGVGTITIAPNGDCTFKPLLNYCGSVPYITYTVADTPNLSTSARVYLNLISVNDAPIARDDSASGDEDTVLSGNVLWNDTDPDGNSLTVTGFSIGGMNYAVGSTATIQNVGNVTIGLNGSYMFTPMANYNGPIPIITYTVTNAGNLRASAGLYLNLNSVNDVPIARDDSVSGDEDAVLSGNVLSNDTDPDNDALNVTGFSIGGVDYPAGSTAKIPDVGTVTIAPNGDYTFTPLANYNGPIPFINYTVADTGNLTASATLSLTLNSVNDAPIARDNVISGNEDTVLSVNVLSNDTDPDGDTLIVTDFSIGGVDYPAGSTATIPDVGTVTIAPNGDCTFKSENNYNGPVPLITYTVVDAGKLTTSARLYLKLISVNDAPIARDDSASGDQGTVLSGNVLANDTDPEGTPPQVTGFSFTDPVSGLTVSGQPGQTTDIRNVGTFRLETNGDYLFASGANYKGTVLLITYTVADTGGLSANADLQLTLHASPNLNTVPSDPVGGAQRLFASAPPRSSAYELLVAPPSAQSIVLAPDAGRYAPQAFDSTLYPHRAGASMAWTHLIEPSHGQPPTIGSYTDASGSDWRVVVHPDTRSQLTVWRGMPDQRVDTDDVAHVSVPWDSFAHTHVDAQVTLEATLADGSPLPPWMNLTPHAGVFELVPPPQLEVELAIRLIARDAEGREAATLFRIQVGERARALNDGAAPIGRAGLSEQLREATRQRPTSLLTLPPQSMRAPAPHIAAHPI